MRTSVDVHNFLLERDAPHEVFLARGRLRSADRIAAVLDLSPDEVGRVVVFETPKGPVAAVVASDREPDPARVAKAVQVPKAMPVLKSAATMPAPAVAPGMTSVMAGVSVPTVGAVALLYNLTNRAEALVLVITHP